MNAIATPLPHTQHAHHHSSSHNHSRSQSDPTKNNTTPTFYHLKTPESDFAKLSSSATSNHEALFQTGALKRKRLDLGSDHDDNDMLLEFKRSRTAPPSPPYELDEDLKLRSPLTINIEAVERARSLSPSKFLATPLASSDPIEPPSSPIRVKPSSMFANSANDYPDTCYKYTTVRNPMDLSTLDNPYNQEWKQRLEILVKADDPVVYSKFKDYCHDVTKSSSSPSPDSFSSTISKKIQDTTNSSLANMISSKYQRSNKMEISSIINFPFENNYTYQSTGYLQDIDVLNRNQDYYRRNPSINLSKYNHVFSQMSSEETDFVDEHKRKHHHYPSQRRKSQYGQYLATGAVTTDLPFNFTPSSHVPQNLSPPLYKSSLVNHKTIDHQTSPHLHTFVHSSQSSPQSAAQPSLTHQHQQYQQPAKILPPTTPKQALLPSPATSPSSKYNHHVRTCISCKSVHSPCWRPSWSIAAGQLCNSCGLRYKKTGAHCLNDKCLRIPAKGEWTLMKNRGKLEVFDHKSKELRYCYKCLHCGGEVDVNE